MPKFGLLFCLVFSLKIYLNLPILLPFFLCLSFLYAVMLNFQMKYSPFLKKIASTIDAIFFRKGEYFIWNEQKVDSKIGSGVFLKMLGGFCM